MLEKKAADFSGWKNNKNKKGLSTVVSTLILILLVLVAVGVIWAVISNILKSGSNQVNLNQFTFDISIKSAYVSGSGITVTVMRHSGGGQLSGLKFIFLNSTQSIGVDENESMNPLDTKTFTFASSQIPGIGAGDTVSVAPVYLSSSGQSTVGNPTDTATISATPPAGAGSGGNTGLTGNPGTGTCGDGIIQIPDGQSINEQCDTNNLNGATCISLGFTGGNLACTNNCQFDTSQCTGPAPASSFCTGTWNQSAYQPSVYECDGGGSPGNVYGCQTDCLCKQGFSPDRFGGCTLNPSLNNGSIRSVWNNIYFDSYDLPASAAVQAYQGDYVNFSNSSQGCFQITFADYLADSQISYVRLDNSMGTPSISAGDNYSIWQAVNCGQ